MRKEVVKADVNEKSFLLKSHNSIIINILRCEAKDEEEVSENFVN